MVLFINSQSTRPNTHLLCKTFFSFLVFDSQVALVVKNLPANAAGLRFPDSNPGLGRSPRGGNGNPLQYSCWENSMHRGAWWATVHGVAKSRTWLNDLVHRTLNFSWGWASERGFTNVNTGADWPPPWPGYKPGHDPESSSTLSLVTPPNPAPATTDLFSLTTRMSYWRHHVLCSLLGLADFT